MEQRLYARKCIRSQLCYHICILSQFERCFIFLGVGTCGLLLGTLLAGSMDKAKEKEVREAQIRDCPQCAKLQRQSITSTSNRLSVFSAKDFQCEGEGSTENSYDIGLDLFEGTSEKQSETVNSTTTPHIHCRHMSIEVSGKMTASLFGSQFPRLGRDSSRTAMGAIDETTPFLSMGKDSHLEDAAEMKFADSGSSYTTSSTADIKDSHLEPVTRLNGAKFVFLTLNQAIRDSGLVIALGTVGFHVIEKMTFVGKRGSISCHDN